MGLPAPSLRVTVMVEVVVLSAGTDVGLATTVEFAATLGVKVTLGCETRVILSIVSVAVYRDVSATAFFTVNVTTPLAFEGPLAAEMVELPVCASVTVLPETGLPKVSFSVTVMVDVVTLSAGSDFGLAMTVDNEALTALQVLIAPIAAWVAAL